MRKMKSCKRNNNVNTRIPKTFEEDINSENADKWKDDYTCTYSPTIEMNSFKLTIAIASIYK
ncbi:hypothetical protein H8356DRAFT_1436228 [Neocallimastix lanati (nom. inval.)]|nr:hypothetical protein H8356DRAFT_1436228 [Neocallimastix sp. JGI-2020a]